MVTGRESVVGWRLGCGTGFVDTVVSSSHEAAKVYEVFLQMMGLHILLLLRIIGGDGRR